MEGACALQILNPESLTYQQRQKLDFKYMCRHSSLVDKPDQKIGRQLEQALSTKHCKKKTEQYPTSQKKLFYKFFPCNNSSKNHLNVFY